jgi:hypothetical protein
VNRVAPALTRTQLLDHLRADTLKASLSRILLGRMGEPEEVALVIAPTLNDPTDPARRQWPPPCHRTAAITLDAVRVRGPASTARPRPTGGLAPGGTAV